MVMTWRALLTAVVAALAVVQCISLNTFNDVTMTGTVTLSSTSTIADLISPSVTITGGGIDTTTVGATTPSSGAFTTVTATTSTTAAALTATAAVTFSNVATIADMISPSVTITGGAIDDTPVGGKTASTGAFTILSSTGGTINGASAGASTPSSGVFTTFRYQATAMLTHVRPSRGLVSGGTEVEVNGIGFVLSSHIACRFGDFAAPAVFFNSATLLCTSPAVTLRSSLGVTVAVQVTNNGLDFSRDKGALSSFTFFPDLVVHSVWPASGPTAGETVVEIRLDGFEALGMSLYCRCGFSDVVASIVDDDSALCLVTTSKLAGSAALEITDERNRSSASASMFSYLANLFTIPLSSLRSNGNPKPRHPRRLLRRLDMSRLSRLRPVKVKVTLIADNRLK